MLFYRRALSLICLTLLVNQLAHAEPIWNGKLYVSSSISDNIGKTNNRKDTDMAVTGGIIVGVSADEKRYSAEGSYNFGTSYYIDHSYKNRNKVTGSMFLVGHVIPGHFSWNLSTSRDITYSNIRLSRTPLNEQDRTILSTGPSIYFQPTNRSKFFLSASFKQTELKQIRSYYSSRSDAIFQQAKWQYKLSPVTDFEISASHQESTFTKESSFDYENDSGILTLSGKRPLFGYRLSGGISKITRTGDEPIENSIAEISLSKELKLGQLSVSHRRKVTDTFVLDAATDVNNVNNALFVPTNIGVLSLVEIHSSNFSASKIRLLPNTYGAINIGHTERQSIEDERINETSINLSTNLSFEYSLTMGYFLRFTYQRNDIRAAPARVDNNYITRAGLNYRPTRKIVMSLVSTFEYQVSSIKAGEFNELSLLGTISYNLR